MATRVCPPANGWLPPAQDGKLRFWDPADGRLLAEWAGHHGRVLAVAFSADGGKVASGGDDRLVTMWDAGTGRPVWRPRGMLTRSARCRSARTATAGHCRL